MPVLFGKEVTEKIYSDIDSNTFANLQKGWTDRMPSLVIVTVGEDPASEVYVRNKIKKGGELGFDVEQIKLEDHFTTDQVVEIITLLNMDSDIDGIIVQLPLPKHIDEDAIKLAVDPNKDVDGFHPMSKFQSCTPLGIMKMLDFYGVKIEGKNALVIGRSDIVGKPMGDYLLDANATVTTAHSRTPKLKLINHIKNADIVIVAVGRPHFIEGSDAFLFKKNAVIIDVGIHRNSEGKLCGDVNYKSIIEERPDLDMSPVPAGVGVCTIAALMHNVFLAWVNNNS